MYSRVSHNERGRPSSPFSDSTRFVKLMHAETAFMYLISQFGQSDTKY